MSSRRPWIPVMIMCSTASPRSWRCFCIVVFEMTPLPALVWLMMAIPHLFREVFVAFEMAQLLALVWSMMAFPHLFREGHSALPLSLLVSTGQLTVWVRWEGFLPAGGVSSSWTLQILWDTCKVCSFCHDCLALSFKYNYKNNFQLYFWKALSKIFAWNIYSDGCTDGVTHIAYIWYICEPVWPSGKALGW